MNTGKLFQLTLSDLRRPDMMKLAAVPFVLSMVILVTVYGGMMAGLFALFDNPDYLPDWILAIGDWPWIGTALGWLLGLLFGLLASLVGFFLISQLFIVLGLFIAGFFTRQIAAKVHAQHYPALPFTGHEQFLPVLWMMMGKLLLWGGLLILSLPLLLIPGIGTVIVNLVLFGLFRSLLLLDVGTTILDPPGYQQLVRRQGGAWAPTGLLYLASLVPLLNVVVPIFSVILGTHLVFLRLQQQAPPNSH